jgi:Holliday junction resolvasome RuvABC endonuclease subunit
VPRNHADGGLLSGKPQDVYLGIDPSLTGFALTAVGMDAFESWEYKSGHRGVMRLMDISLWLSMKIEHLESKGFHVADAAIEDSVVHSHAAVVLGELHGAVKIALYHALNDPGRLPLKVPPATVKKYATGRGNAKKNEVMLSAYKHWGVEFTSDNLADSYVIARLCQGYATTTYQKEIVSKIHGDPKFRDAPPTF